MDKDIIIAIISYVLPVLITSLSGYLIGKKVQKKKARKEQLINHPLFAELENMKIYFTNQYQGKDVGRTALAVELIVHKINIWLPILKNLAEDIQKCTDQCTFESPSCSKIFNTNMNYLNQGMIEYTNWHKKRDGNGKLIDLYNIYGDRKYNQESRDTMDVYVQKFKQWHSSREEIMHEIIQDFSHTQFTPDCYRKQWDIFSAYQFVFAQMKIDAEKSLKELNGELTGKKFLGVEIGDEH